MYPELSPKDHTTLNAIPVTLRAVLLQREQGAGEQWEVTIPLNSPQSIHELLQSEAPSAFVIQHVSVPGTDAADGVVDRTGQYYILENERLMSIVDRSAFLQRPQQILTCAGCQVTLA